MVKSQLQSVTLGLAIQSYPKCLTLPGCIALGDEEDGYQAWAHDETAAHPLTVFFPSEKPTRSHANSFS